CNGPQRRSDRPGRPYPISGVGGCTPWRVSPGAGHGGPAPGPTKALLRSTHWSGRPSNHLFQRDGRLYPGGRVVPVSRNSRTQYIGHLVDICGFATSVREFARERLDNHGLACCLVFFLGHPTITRSSVGSFAEAFSLPGWGWCKPGGLVGAVKSEAYPG